MMRGGTEGFFSCSPPAAKVTFQNGFRARCNGRNIFSHIFRRHIRTQQLNSSTVANCNYGTLLLLSVVIVDCHVPDMSRLTAFMYFISLVFEIY